MIELEGVTKRYGDVVAVEDLSFSVADGEVCVLIGPSGCGKSTTIKMINRVIEPSSGRILIDGKPAGGERPEVLRRRIGYVIQSIGLFPHMSVAENIAVVPKLLRWDAARIRFRVDELLALIGLNPESYRGKYPRDLSGGEAQRIGVARALAADPPLLLMDEPFGAVDPLGRLGLQSEFLKIQRRLRKTVIFVTHDLDEAIRIADRIVLLDRGRLVQEDTPERLLSEPRNGFVKSFVGTDRALKRLSRFLVADHLRPARSLSVDDPELASRAGALKEEGARFAWISDRAGRLFGWLDLAEALGDPTRSLTRAAPSETGVLPTDSLRDALSRMLGQGITVVPVVDDDGRLVGELSLADVERLTEV